jgi:fatty acid desaturase
MRNKPTRQISSPTSTPRLDFERLPGPRWVKDWFTNKPILDGKSSSIKLGPISYIALNNGIAAAAAAASAALVTWAPIWTLPLLPWLMLIQTGRLRKNSTLFGHEASHGNIFLRTDPRRDDKSPKFLGLDLNDLIGELCTTFALAQNMREYGAGHDPHHDEATYTTAADPDTIFMLKNADFPRCLLDPRSYAKDFWSRLKSNLWATQAPSETGGATPYYARRLLGWAWIATLAGLAFVLPLPAWLVSVFIPYVILFRISAILQMLSLHLWNLPPAQSHQEYANRTFGRFSGIPLPTRGLRGFTWWKSWAAWWTEILLLELPFRLAVLSSDLAAHDVHHLEYILALAMKRLPEVIDDWRNQPFRRAEVIRDSGDALNMAAREFWGCRAMWKAIARDNLTRLNAKGD